LVVNARSELKPIETTLHLLGSVYLHLQVPLSPVNVKNESMFGVG